MTGKDNFIMWVHGPGYSSFENLMPNLVIFTLDAAMWPPLNRLSDVSCIRVSQCLHCTCIIISTQIIRTHHRLHWRFTLGKTDIPPLYRTYKLLTPRDNKVWWYCIIVMVYINCKHITAAATAVERYYYLLYGVICYQQLYTPCGPTCRCIHTTTAVACCSRPTGNWLTRGTPRP